MGGVFEVGSIGFPEGSSKLGRFAYALGMLSVWARCSGEAGTDMSCRNCSFAENVKEGGAEQSEAQQIICDARSGSQSSGA